MNLTYVKGKGIVTVEERKVLLDECSELLNKEIMLLNVIEPKGTYRPKLKIQVGIVEGVSWSTFCNYPVFKVRVLGSKDTLEVSAEKWGVTMFEEIRHLTHALRRFFNGHSLCLKPTLERRFAFTDFVWPTRGGIIANGSCNFSQNNQVLGFDMKSGIIEVVRMELQGSVWKMSNGKEYSIEEYKPINIEDYKHHALMYKSDDMSYMVEDLYIFNKDIEQFISSKRLLEKQTTENEMEVPLMDNDNIIINDLSKETLMGIISEVISAKISEDRIRAAMSDITYEVVEEVLRRLEIN